MATTNTAPEAIAQPFANNGDKTFPIPSADVGTNAASLDKGIPSICSEPLDTTGLPVRRSDFNALGYLATSGLFFAQNGGFYTFNSAVSSAIGGYPTGAKLWATVDSESVLVRSLKDNNTDNFVTTPSYIGNGTSWAMDVPSNTYVDKYSMKYSGETVFNGTAPATYTDLDLSDTVGENRAFVHLSIKLESGGVAAWVRVRPNGETEDRGLDSSGPGGTTGSDIGPESIGNFSVITDSSGIIEWIMSSGSGTFSVKVLAYQVLK